MASGVGNFTHITTSTTTNITPVKFLVRVIINNPGVSGTNTLTLQDGVAGTTIAVALLQNNMIELAYNCVINSGTLSVVTVGATPSDITVMCE